MKKKTAEVIQLDSDLNDDGSTKNFGDKFSENFFTFLLVEDYWGEDSIFSKWGGWHKSPLQKRSFDNFQESVWSWPMCMGQLRL